MKKIGRPHKYDEALSEELKIRLTPGQLDALKQYATDKGMGTADAFRYLLHKEIEGFDASKLEMKFQAQQLEVSSNAET